MVQGGNETRWACTRVPPILSITYLHTITQFHMVFMQTSKNFLSLHNCLITVPRTITILRKLSVRKRVGWFFKCLTTGCVCLDLLASRDTDSFFYVPMLLNLMARKVIWTNEWSGHKLQRWKRGTTENLLCPGMTSAKKLSEHPLSGAW